jgi:asparaginyl-tRNA synthetase
MTLKRIINILRSGNPEETVKIQGWVRTKRDSKGFSFLEVNDGSSLQNLQVIIDSSLPNYDTLIKQISTGASVEIIGELAPSLGKGQRIELKASDLVLYGEGMSQ